MSEEEKNVPDSENPFKILFKQLVKIGIINEEGEFLFSLMEFKREELMPFVAEKFSQFHEASMYVAFLGELNGDTMHDPMIEIVVLPEYKVALAISYRNDYVGYIHRADPKDSPKIIEHTMFTIEMLNNFFDYQYNLEKTYALDEF